jgi:hypothetical protein
MLDKIGIKINGLLGSGFIEFAAPKLFVKPYIGGVGYGLP